jgi:hypothetical protein
VLLLLSGLREGADNRAGGPGETRQRLGRSWWTPSGCRGAPPVGYDLPRTPNIHRELSHLAALLAEPR